MSSESTDQMLGKLLEAAEENTRQHILLNLGIVDIQTRLNKIENCSANTSNSVKKMEPVVAKLDKTRISGYAWLAGVGMGTGGLGAWLSGLLKGTQ